MKRLNNIDIEGLDYDNSCILGVGDATKEWNDNPNLAKKNFLYTQTYNSFLNKNSLILLGRTGTGKTAILRYTEDRINNCEETQYKDVLRIGFEDLIRSFSNIEEFENKVKTNDSLKDCLEVIIYYRIMQHICSSVKYENIDKKMISACLKEKGMISADLYDKIKEMLKISSKAENKIGHISSSLLLISNLIDILKTNDYQSAVNQVHDVLKETSLLVLIDTKNEYDIKDLREVIIVKALIATCFSFYNRNKNTNIHVKISIPSEIHTYILHELPGKHQSNTVPIHWGYKDLLFFIAFRINSLNEISDNSLWEKVCTSEMESLYKRDDKSLELAKTIMGTILPLRCPTSLNYSFNTFAYCIRHTLKKPRELLLIFNKLFSVIETTGDLEFFKKNPDRIRTIIHSCQEELINSALSMYHSSYKDIGQAISKVFNNKPFILDYNTLNSALKEANAWIQNRRYNYDMDDLRRIIFESGLIGKINNRSLIKTNNDVLQNKNEVKLYTVLFEYQIKGKLSINKDDLFAIHPMCYEHYNCYIDENSLVYPESATNEKDSIYSKITKDYIS